MRGASLSYCSMQSLEQNQGHHPEVEGGDGVLREGHRGEGLLEVIV